MLIKYANVTRWRPHASGAGTAKHSRQLDMRTFGVFSRSLFSCYTAAALQAEIVMVAKGSWEEACSESTAQL
jgi:hypothetical protein